MYNKENIKLDEVLKMLFSVSNPLVIKIVNYFFDESFNENQDYKIEFTSTESAHTNLELLKADFFIKIEKVPSFHFEFQLNQTTGMVLRMFEYGYREALKHIDEEENIKIICFPKQTVFYLEEQKNIPDELKMKIIFPITDLGEQTVIYKTIIKKAWEIKKEEKIEKGLYSLLPLEIFKLRKKVEKVKTAAGDELSMLSESIKNDTIEIINIASKCMNDGTVTEEDYNKIVSATTYLLEYFSKNYADLKLSKEVSEVGEYIYTKGKNEGYTAGKNEGYTAGKNEGYIAGKNEGINVGIKEGEKLKQLEIAMEMLRKGLDIEFVSEVTKLPKEKVKELLEKINSQNN